MSLVVCPNCKKEFFVGDKLYGECPNCKIKLIFRGKNEIVERIDIKEIEKKVDEIISMEKITDIDKILIESLNVGRSIEEIEKKVDEIIG